MEELETSGLENTLKDFNLGNIPPAGSPFAGKFFKKIWEEAKKDKIQRLGLHSRWGDLHNKFRGKQEQNSVFKKISANYIFKTVQGFCAMLTEKYPRAEVFSEDEGVNQEQVKALDQETKNWWHEFELQNMLYASVQNFQVYGTTIEKYVFDLKTDTAKVILCDPFNFFPTPGYKLCSMDMPAAFHAFFLEEWQIREKFNVPRETHIPKDADDELFGTQRETTRGGEQVSGKSNSNLPSNYAFVGGTGESPTSNKTLVVELWIKDESVEEIPVMGEVQSTYDTGEPVYDDQMRPVMTKVQTGSKTRSLYPGGIRKVTIAPGMKQIILDDMKNPNVNWDLIDERMAFLMSEGLPQPVIDELGQPVIDPATQQPVMQSVPFDEDTAYEMAHDTLADTWLYNHFPFGASSSLIDTTQWFGFSIIEQIEVLTGRADALLTKYFAYLDSSLFPILLLPTGCGVDDSEVTNAPGLILKPTIEGAPQIRFVERPQAPSDFLAILQFVLYQVDIISQSPEVTEGRKPKGVSAASAIIALQDKAATLLQPQIWAVDKIIRDRGRAFISMIRNFGTKEKPVKVDDEFIKFIGIDLIGSFKIMVESGSSAPITKQGRRQMYIELHRLGAMTVKSLLEMLDIPPKVIEEVLEQNSVPGALNLLVQAGLPPEVAQEVYKIVLNNPGIGGGNSGEGGKTPSSQPTGPPKNTDRMKSVYNSMSTTG